MSTVISDPELPDNKTQNTIYGDRLPEMEKVLDELNVFLGEIRETLKQKNGIDPVEHCRLRIKTDESMREKCRRNGLPETAHSALTMIHDAIGARIVCAFLNDVYAIRNILADSPDFELIEEKDYIRHAKSNGYRSLHLIFRYKQGFFTEVQLRTISMDTWAALEHHLKYKKQVAGNEKLLVQELKRCADELASTDISMQTLRDMIMADE